MTVHYTEFQGVAKGRADNSGAFGEGGIQAPRGALFSASLATNTASAAFNGSTRFVRVRTTVDSWIAYAAMGTPDPTASPRIFLGAGQFDYIAVDPSGKIKVLDA